jgi:hypothetical protein
MTTATASVNQTLSQRVEDLQNYIATGRILDAMNEFYSADVVMQENAKPGTAGLAANIEREKQFLAYVKTWVGYTVKSVSIGKDTAAVESVIEFVGTDGKDVRIEQVSVTKWVNGKIVHERFYYDASGK